MEKSPSLSKNDISLDTVEQEYVVENSKRIPKEGFDISTQPLSVRLGQKDGEPFYLIDEISFDNEKVREVFGRERTNKLDNLISINIFGLDLDENDTIGEEYVEIRDGILTSYCDDLRKDMSVSDRDIEVMKVMIDRKFLQFDALTAPFADENVEKVEVSGDGVFVTIDGVEYMTNISVNYIGLDRYITELAQRSGRQISSADKIVEIEEYSNIPSDDYFREFDRLYLYLLEEEEFNLGNETCIVVEFM